MSNQQDEQGIALRDAVYDAFMALWRAAEVEQAHLWVAYVAAQARYEAYLVATE